MTDKEQLELAAKAAGLDGEYCEPNHEPAMYIQPGTLWMPLTDDGDALRLAVKLNMTVSVERRVIEVEFYQNGDVYAVEEDGEKRAKDPLVATRRAIVRAAAEIGKAMP